MNLEALEEIKQKKKAVELYRSKREALVLDRPSIIQNLRELGEKTRDSSTLYESGLEDEYFQLQTKTPVEVEELIESALQNVTIGGIHYFTVPFMADTNKEYVHLVERYHCKKKTFQRKQFLPKSKKYPNNREDRKYVQAITLMTSISNVCFLKTRIMTRALYYEHEDDFFDVPDCEAMLEEVSCILGCTRASLCIDASSKDLVTGEMVFEDRGKVVDCMKAGVHGATIPASVDGITAMTSTANFILLVEKETVFQRISISNFCKDHGCILITGKGQPDVGTRFFLNKLKSVLQNPILALMDCNPYACRIMCAYRFGSKSMAYDSYNLATNEIMWLRLRPSDLGKYGIPERCRLEMDDDDDLALDDLLKEEYILVNPKWGNELKMMRP